MYWRVVIVCSIALATAGLPTARADDLQLPNLRPRAAEDVEIGPADGTLGETSALRFTTISQNIGEYALDLLSIEQRDEEHFKAEQCIRWNARICLERRDVGDIYFEDHSGHYHWHFEDFALYELRRIVDGDVDFSPEGLVGESKKQSFCMMDTDPVEPGPLVEQYLRSPRFYLACLGALQGISAGWQDRYGAGIWGQEIAIDGVPDGEYALVLTLDPERRLFESNDDDNTSVRRLLLVEDGTAVVPLD